MEECVITQASGLPEGWRWFDYDDGSGSLNAPDNKEWFFSYDKGPYRAQGWTEFKANNHSQWSIFYDGFAEYKNYAESSVREMLEKEQSVQSGIRM